MKTVSRSMVRVLLIIGSQAIKDSVRDLLTHSEDVHFQVTSVETLSGGSELASQGPFDSIIIGLFLPDGQGPEVVARLREKVPRIPVTVVVSKEDKEIGKKALAYGAQNLAIQGHFDEVSFPSLIQCAIEKKNIEEMNKTLRVVNSILRHDILNNLTVVGGSLEIYKMKKEERFLVSASTAVDKSVDLIKKMKEVETTISPKEMKQMNVRAMLEEMVTKYAGQKMTFRITGEGTVLADEALSSVFDNIINNAIVHSGSPIMNMAIKQGGGEGGITEIRLADEGVGIPNEVKPKIWQEGFRYGKSGQSGLGLFIVKKVLERYGGTITVEDNQPKGTVFVVRLLSG